MRTDQFVSANVALAGGGKALGDDQFIRCAAVYVYWKYLIKSGLVAFPRDIDVAEDVMEFRSHLGNLGLKNKPSPGLSDEAQTDIR